MSLALSDYNLMGPLGDENGFRGRGESRPVSITSEERREHRGRCWDIDFRKLLSLFFDPHPSPVQIHHRSSARRVYLSVLAIRIRFGLTMLRFRRFTFFLETR